MIRRATDAMTRTETRFHHGPFPSVIERVRKLCPANRCHSDIQVGERIFSLITPKVANAHQPTLTCDQCATDDALRDSAADEGLGRAHHLQVSHVRDGSLADRHIEHRQVLVGETRRADDRPVLIHVGEDLLDLLVVVPERVERQRYGPVDDRHLSAADELLELDQREVGFNACGVTIHQKADSSGGGNDHGLCIAIAICLASSDRLVPSGACLRQQGRVRARGIGNQIRRVSVHPHDSIVRVAILGVAFVRPHGRSRSRGAEICATCHQRRDRRGNAAPGIGVVRHAVRHQISAEVGVAQPQLPESAGVVADLLGRIARRRHDDLLREEHDVDRVLERLDVERAVRPPELHEVQGREVAGRVVDVHVLAVVYDDSRIVGCSHDEVVDVLNLHIKDRNCFCQGLSPHASDCECRDRPRGIRQIADGFVTDCSE